MTADNIVALIISVLLVALPGRGAALPGEVLIMSAASWLQFIVFIVVVVATAYPLGIYMAKVYGDDEKAPGDRFFRPDRQRDLPHLPHRPEARAALDGLRVLADRVQHLLVPRGVRVAAVPGPPAVQPDRRRRRSFPHLSFNTAVSFMTNTNWQSYGGEATMSHLTQMVGLAVQNFVSAAAGMATLAALIRGLSRRRASTIGNFWVDLDAIDHPHPAAARVRRGASCS